MSVFVASHSASPGLFQTVWIPVIVSAAVATLATLLTEYLANPWLEMRKDRLIDESRMRREIIRDLDHVTFLTGQMIVAHNNLHLPGYQRRLMSWADELEPAIKRAIENIDFKDELQNVWYRTTAHVVGFVINLHAGEGRVDDSLWKDFDFESDRLDNFVELLKARRLHWLKRHRLVHSIKSKVGPAPAEQHAPTATG
jgi:hypothetical protein